MQGFPGPRVIQAACALLPATFCISGDGKQADKGKKAGFETLCQHTLPYVGFVQSIHSIQSSWLEDVKASAQRARVQQT